MSRHQGCESISIKWLTPDVWRPPKVNHSTICYMTTLSIFCERNMYSCANKYDLEVRGPRLCFHQLAWMCLCVDLCGLLQCILSAGWAAWLCLLGPGVSTAISLPSTLCGDSCSKWIKNVLLVYDPSNSLQSPNLPHCLLSWHGNMDLTAQKLL